MAREVGDGQSQLGGDGAAGPGGDLVVGLDPDEQSWARIAAECGYADQAHLTREFRRFSGTTPGALITA